MAHRAAEAHALQREQLRQLAVADVRRTKDGLRIFPDHVVRAGACTYAGCRRLASPPRWKVEVRCGCAWEPAYTCGHHLSSVLQRLALYLPDEHNDGAFIVTALDVETW